MKIYLQIFEGGSNYICRATEKMNPATLNYRGINERAKETISTFLRQIYCTK